MVSQTRTFLRRLQHYFHDYGGWKRLFLSPLFIVALLISLLSYDWWLDADWRSLSLSLLPSLLGFSLGTYAILFSLMTNRLKRALRSVSNDRGIPFLREINATFFHFIFVQVIALGWAIASKGTLIYDVGVGLDEVDTTNNVLTYLDRASGFIGTLLLLYALMLVIGAALVVHRIASIVDAGAD